MRICVSMIGECAAGCACVCKSGSVRRGRDASSAHSCATEMTAAASATMAAATATGAAAGMSACSAAGRDAG